LAGYARRLEGIDPARLLAVMRLVGLDDPGPAIPVLLVPEESPLAARTPAWIAGYARADSVIVLFAARTPSYPHESLPELLQHEVTHVLIARAAGGRPVPRWFHEGVALVAERGWSLGERTRLAYHLAFGGAASVASLDALFATPQSVSRAYDLSGAFVQDLLQQHGPDMAARILACMRTGEPFERAFASVTGASVTEANDAFWHRRRLWVSWLPWVTSPGTVYGVMTMLALAAILRVRMRRAARRRVAEFDGGDASVDDRSF
jgi:hypothetical protein